VQDMRYMFNGATSFNYSIANLTWNTSKAKTHCMFGTPDNCIPDKPEEEEEEEDDSTDYGEYIDIAKAYPETWYVEQKWPECTATFDHVGDNQGLCANDWAHAGITVLNSRLCIGTEGEMDGIQLSVGFATACYASTMGLDPCSKDDPQVSFQGRAFLVGVLAFMPPGGPGAPLAQCYNVTPNKDVTNTYTCPTNATCQNECRCANSRAHPTGV